ncbi:hypothetical protein L1887_30853 [Cichorium endivia]|nr:hypothetical protein L1887_30853 [Cichorium endivia]
MTDDSIDASDHRFLLFASEISPSFPTPPPTLAEKHPPPPTTPSCVISLSTNRSYLPSQALIFGLGTNLFVK